MSVSRNKPSYKKIKFLIEERNYYIFSPKESMNANDYYNLALALIHNEYTFHNERYYFSLDGKIPIQAEDIDYDIKLEFAVEILALKVKTPEALLLRDKIQLLLRGDQIKKILDYEKSLSKVIRDINILTSSPRSPVKRLAKNENMRHSRSTFFVKNQDELSLIQASIVGNSTQFKNLIENIVTSDLETIELSLSYLTDKLTEIKNRLQQFTNPSFSDRSTPSPLPPSPSSPPPQQQNENDSNEKPDLIPGSVNNNLVETPNDLALNTRRRSSSNKKLSSNKHDFTDHVLFSNASAAFNIESKTSSCSENPNIPSTATNKSKEDAEDAKCSCWPFGKRNK